MEEDNSCLSSFPGFFHVFPALCHVHKYSRQDGTESANKKAHDSGKQPMSLGSPDRKRNKTLSAKYELLRRYPVRGEGTVPPTEDPASLALHKKAIGDELAKSNPRDSVLLPLLKLTYTERRMYIQEAATSVSEILTENKALSRPAVVSNVKITL